MEIEFIGFLNSDIICIRCNKISTVKITKENRDKFGCSLYSTKRVFVYYCFYCNRHFIEKL